jgi:hypothetical protein
MATISLTEILGSDNIAGSRITINDNFKKVANSLNTIETYIDTSFTPGAALNVGSALVKKYTRPITDQIFTCEATGLFGGNLNVGQDLGVTRDLVTSRNATIHGNFTIDGTVGANLFTSMIPMKMDSPVVNSQLYNGVGVNTLYIDPQTLTSPTTTSTTRNIVTTASFKKVSVIRLSWNAYTGAGTTNCDAISLPVVTDPNVLQGQIITLLVDTVAASAYSGISFKLDLTNMDSAYNNILFNDSTTYNTNDTDMRQAAITVYADATGWRVLHATGLTVLIN